MNTTVRGIGEALVSAFLFALIPLFFIPLHRAGMSSESGAFYRLFFAALLALGIVLWRKHSLRISRAQLRSLMGVVLSYTVVTIGFFTSLTLMPSGIAATLLFTNPLFVMLFMFLFYKEKVEAYKIILSLITCLGIASMSGFFSSQMHFTLEGFAYIMLASLAYATYIISISQAKKHNIGSDVLSFYLFFISSVALLVYAIYKESFMLPRSGEEILSLMALALCTAFLSNLLLIMAIAKIGSTLSSILGTLEPVIAVSIGIALFSEPASYGVLGGIALTIVSVSLITIIPFWRQKAL